MIDDTEGFVDEGDAVLELVAGDDGAGFVLEGNELEESEVAWVFA